MTELRAAHATGSAGGAGVNVRRGRVTDMRHEHVLQPLHVTASALALATETVRAILKIDDIVSPYYVESRNGRHRVIKDYLTKQYKNSIVSNN